MYRCLWLYSAGTWWLLVLLYTCILVGRKLRVGVMARIPLCLTSRIQDREGIGGKVMCIRVLGGGKLRVRVMARIPLCLTPRT